MADKEGLDVIALISGGKDSFFSVLHCLANGHRVVALANLHPPAPPTPHQDGGAEGEAEQEEDLNSFMYQTVGHQVVPLYAEATGIPVYRQVISGGAGQHGKDYSHHHSPSNKAEKEADGDDDETESMIPLLQKVKAAHPEANAICAGAILSTYQRTRVESVATRLGLVPLAYLWKFPVLPSPSLSDAQLLDDMAAVGLEARIIKVASGGLDDSFLWTNVASAAGRARIARSMRRFGTAETGAVIGEGGEFETIVLDGPARLFKKRIVVDETDRSVVSEGGGTAWLGLRNPRLEAKNDEEDGEETGGCDVRTPDLLDARFARVQDTLSATKGEEDVQPLTLPQNPLPEFLQLGGLQTPSQEKLQHWCLVASLLEPISALSPEAAIKAETQSIVDQVRQRLELASLLPSAIVTTTILLRRMSDFPVVNAIYGSLFDAPNPPSRVTISCGDHLGRDANIAVHLVVHGGLSQQYPKQQSLRQGLHVQSRSYWAPANIGPYSQAISVPIASLAAKSSGEVSTSTGGGPRLVSIAGQIPLVPATMALPVGDDDTLKLQLSLSLQHLWRIGLEVGVQWWTSAVVYFPSSGCDKTSSSKLRASLAAKAWEAAHHYSTATDEDDSGDESGPDLWDRKFNPQYMTYTDNGGESEEQGPTLPDWNVLPSEQQGKKPVPLLFAAEVDELPRAAGAEWHAHLGVAQAEAESVSLICSSVGGEGGPSSSNARYYAHQTIIKSKSGGPTVVHTVVTERGEEETSRPPQTFERQDSVARAALSRLDEVVDGKKSAGGQVSAVTRYVDITQYSSAAYENQKGQGDALEPVVPCASLWGSNGQRLASVMVYQSVFE